MALPLAGRVAIVTGASGRIGAAIGRRLARDGARVVVTGRRATALQETSARIAADGGEVLALPADAADPGQVRDLVAATVRRFGTVDVLAAIAGGQDPGRSIADLDLRAWESVFRSNVTTAFVCAQAVLPILRSKQRGTILTCAGGGAFLPSLGAPILAYACAKAALCRFTDQLTAELWDEPGVRVNCLDPGAVGDDATLAEVAELAAFLAGDASTPLRGRLLSTHDAWWRDRRRIAEVDATVHLYRLRRHTLDE